MGYQRAYEMAFYGGQRAAIIDHLLAGTYPPLGLEYKQIANAAVSAMLTNDGGTLLTWKGEQFPAHEVVALLDLEGIVDALRAREEG